MFLVIVSIPIKYCAVAISDKEDNNTYYIVFPC